MRKKSIQTKRQERGAINHRKIWTKRKYQLSGRNKLNSISNNDKYK